MHQHGVKISEKTVLADRLLVVVINQTEQNETKVNECSQDLIRKTEGTRFKKSTAKYILIEIH